MPRWFLATIAVLALGYSGVVTYLYLDERADDDPRYGTEYLEGQLVDSLDKKDAGDLTNVICVKKDRVTFRCIGDLVPSISAIKDEYPDEQLSDQDVDALRKRETGPVSYEATMDPDTGAFVTRTG